MRRLPLLLLSSLVLCLVACGSSKHAAPPSTTTGPVIDPAGSRLRAGEAVPTAFFMIVLRREADGHFRSLAVEMPNADITDPIDRYLVPIAQIERQTGLSFDTALPADEQEALKGEAARSLW